MIYRMSIDVVRFISYFYSRELYLGLADQLLQCQHYPFGVEGELFLI